ncbi:phenylacetic acid degradation operon negative regulatory protein [Rhodococcus sp. 27YEA15]|uniref:PaaX family transcriptional regulator n=1 Tax=Rhodococcus sp. 27YEA15 TaxID=3156259 RepID=UPI003C799B9B
MDNDTFSCAIAGAVLDDLESRPGSVTSLARTVLGAYVRDLGGWCAIAEFAELLSVLGVSPQSTRTAVARLKSKGVLDAESRDGRSGYVITDAAEAMFSRGDPRIFGFRRMERGDSWRLISFGIPESERAARHQLRRRLSSIGVGTVSAGLWICPDYLSGEVRAIVAALDLTDYVTSFRVEDLDVPTTVRDAAAQWWDLDELARRHREFLDHTNEIAAREDTVGRDAFERFVPVLDEWRIIPYLDPGLPDDMLPPDWPGVASVELFAEMRRRCLEPSKLWAASICASSVTAQR